MKQSRSEPANEPETLKIAVVTERHSPGIVEPISDAEEIVQNTSPSYSQLVQDGRRGAFSRSISLSNGAGMVAL